MDKNCAKSPVHHIVQHLKSSGSTLALPALGLICALPLLSACSLASLPKGYNAVEKQTVAELDSRNYIPRSEEERAAILTQDLFAQAAFWSREFDVNPADLEAATNLSNTLRRLGNPKQSIAIATQTRALYPRDAGLLTELAASHIALSQPKQAIDLIDQALATSPRNGRSWSLKGAALDQLELYTQARQNYTKALSLSPRDPSIMANIGLSYALEGDPKTAEVWLRRAANMPGANANVRQNLALVLELQGNTTEANKWANWDNPNQKSPTLEKPKTRAPSVNHKLTSAPAQPTLKQASLESKQPTQMPSGRTPLTTLSTSMNGVKSASDAARFAFNNRNKTQTVAAPVTGPAMPKTINVSNAKNPYGRPSADQHPLGGSVHPNILSQLAQKNTPKTSLAQQQNAHYQARLQNHMQQQAAMTAQRAAQNQATNQQQMQRGMPRQQIGGQYPNQIPAGYGAQNQVQNQDPRAANPYYQYKAQAQIMAQAQSGNANRQPARSRR